MTTACSHNAGATCPVSGGGGPGATTRPNATATTEKTASADSAGAAAGVSLFDGKSMGHWKDTNFAGSGEPRVEDGNLILPSGERLTGINWAGEELPKVNYEISLQAKRVDGSDFFCGLTFPVGDSFASLIVGGWGGALVGISCIDDEDAAHNAAKSYHTFDDNKWYTVRVRVTPTRLEAWLDQEKIVDVATAGKKFSLRGDIEDSKPLGIASFQTTAAIKDIRLKKVAG
jgi:hypothetical protein